MAPEGQKPSKWRCLTKLPREMYSQPIVHKALAWGCTPVLLRPPYAGAMASPDWMIHATY
jgi:hypothetical protein